MSRHTNVIGLLGMFLLFGLRSSPTVAELPPERFLVLSNGQITCGEFLSDNVVTQKADTEWVLGYISGRNVAAQQMAGASYTRLEPVILWLQNYCRSQPFKHLVEAAEELRDDFLRRERAPTPKPQ